MGSAKDALRYAEQQLGVHTVFDFTVEAQRKLDTTLGELDKARDTKRHLTGAIEGRNLELLHSEWSKHPDHSAARMDQHMKLVKHGDQALKDFRIALEAAEGQVQGLEFDAEMLRHDIRTGQARMTELGGYLQYLAAIKLAAIHATPTTPPTP